ncbi:MAG: DNA repair exonuclease [Planctomycetes bacterium]|nr:DNA repair exonuclease [Planctomycetota bacterium]
MLIVHAADLHLDSPLVGLERYEGAPVDAIRGATRRAFTSLVDLCLAESAGLLLLAGDLYDGDWRDYSTGLFLVAQLARLRESGTAVVLVRGNHDAASVITRELPLPEHVHELSTDAPQTWVDERLGVAVHGQGFATRAVTDDLAARFPAPRAGLLNVGLLHTALDGRAGHDPYAPTSVETLANKGYDYWALGHVHQREVVRKEPWIVFPGNLQGRGVHESGPKGATLVTVDDGRIVSVRPRSLDAVRFGIVPVGVSECDDGDAAVAAALAALRTALDEAEGRLLAARVEFLGTSAAHDALALRPEHWDAQVRAAALDLPGETWIERVRVRTRPPLDRALLAERDDPVGRLVATLARLPDDPAALASLRAEFDGLLRALPAQAREGRDALVLDDAALVELLREAEDELLPRLLHGDVP